MKEEKKYQIIYADPPWAYRNMGNIQATANTHYPTMENKDSTITVPGGMKFKLSAE